MGLTKAEYNELDQMPDSVIYAYTDGYNLRTSVTSSGQAINGQ